MAILSLLFKSKSDNNKKNPSKPFTERPMSEQNPKKRLEDYAKEIFGEFQNVDEDRPIRRQPQPTPVAPQPVRSTMVEKQTHKERPKKVVVEVPKEKSTGRFSTHNKKPNQPVVKVKNHSLLPQDDQELLRAIIFSEVIGPPKSKR